MGFSALCLKPVHVPTLCTPPYWDQRSNVLCWCQDRMSVAGIFFCFKWIKFLIAVAHERADAGICFLNLLYQKMSCIFFFYFFCSHSSTLKFCYFCLFSIFVNAPCRLFASFFLLLIFNWFDFAAACHFYCVHRIWDHYTTQRVYQLNACIFLVD